MSSDTNGDVGSRNLEHEHVGETQARHYGK